MDAGNMNNLGNRLSNKKIAIVGGGKLCKAFIKAVMNAEQPDRPHILAVADASTDAVGIHYAQSISLATFQDYRSLFDLEDLEVIVELTGDHSLMDRLQNEVSPAIEVIEHFDAQAILDQYRLAQEKNRILQQLSPPPGDAATSRDLFIQFYSFVQSVMERRHHYARIDHNELMGGERALAQIVQGSTVATFVINKEHRITHWNKAIEKLSDHSSASMVGTRNQWLPFWENERPTMADVVLDQLEATEIEKLYIKWRKSPLIDGAYEAEDFFPNLGKFGKWCFFTAAPIKSSDGSIIGAIETLWDRTAYKLAEDKYFSLFNNDPNPIFILNSQTLQILDLNQRAQDFYGYGRKDLIGTSFLELGEENDWRLEEGLQSITADQSCLFSRKCHFRKDGQSFFVNINVCSSKIGTEEVLIANTTDITESVEKDTQLIQASKMTTLGQMAAGMAHEINQPLNVIQVCADFLLKMLRKGKNLTESDLKKIATDLRENVGRAAQIISHMRDFSRQSQMVHHKVNINDPIKDVFKVLGHQLKAHEIELNLDLSQSLLLIIADHNRLEQVFINLVTNAIDAMDEKEAQTNGAVVEKILTIRSWNENGYVLVNVSDTGIGMSREVINKIFEPFFTTKAVGKGTGLGVSISYGIVQDYEGIIEIDSKVGEGSTFRLRFPAAGQDEENHGKNITD
jgi:PAS domain S-box-containing protein